MCIDNVIIVIVSNFIQVKTNFGWIYASCNKRSLYYISYNNKLKKMAENSRQTKNIFQVSPSCRRWLTCSRAATRSASRSASLLKRPFRIPKNSDQVKTSWRCCRSCPSIFRQLFEPRSRTWLRDLLVDERSGRRPRSRCCLLPPPRWGKPPTESSDPGFRRRTLRPIKERDISLLIAAIIQSHLAFESRDF